MFVTGLVTLRLRGGPVGIAPARGAHDSRPSCLHLTTQAVLHLGSRRVPLDLDVRLASASYRGSVHRHRRGSNDARTTLAARSSSRHPGERFGRVLLNDKQNIVGAPQPLIEAPAHNCRRIAAAVRVDAPLLLLWQVLTDYDRLAEFIPNLALSRTCPHPSGGIRLQQEGMQNIFGFRFRAAVLMDMDEVIGASESGQQRRSIFFDMVQSRDFCRFEGEWYLEEWSTQRPASDGESTSNEHLNASQREAATMLGYVVEIVPRHMLPVRLVEWRIREDLMPNLVAVKREAERRYLQARRAEAVLQSRRDATGPS